MSLRQRALVLVVAVLTAAGATGPARAAVSVLSAPAAPVAATPKVDPLLTKQLAAAKATDRLLVFVQGTTIVDARGAVAKQRMRTVHDFAEVATVAAVGTPAQIAALTTTKGLKFLEANRTMRGDLDSSHRATRGQEARHHFQPEFAPEIDGSGVSIAVIDSGVDGTHPFFRRADGSSKVRRNLKFVCADALYSVTESGTDDAGACEGVGGQGYIDSPVADTDTIVAGGHGTHVAGIAAGVDVTLSDGTKLHGAAPGADLIALSSGAAVSILSGAVGMHWVLRHHADPCGNNACPAIRFVNNSWSPDAGDYNPATLVGRLSDALVSESVVVAFAAKNTGGDGSTNQVNPYAQNPTPGVIGVANYDDGGTGTRDGELDSASARGQKGRTETYPDISAPGANILSSCRIYLAVCTEGVGKENGDYNVISGTSMATPHIAGIVAQLFQVDPTLTPAQVEDVLEDTAHKFSFGGAYEPDLPARNGDDSTSFDKGHGLVDVVDAVARVLDVDPGPQPTECSVDGPVIVDEVGDANTIAGISAPIESDPALDIVDGHVAWDAAAQALTFTLSITDLATLPDGKIGYRWDFHHGGLTLVVQARHDSATAAQTFVLGYVDTITQEVLDDLQGAIDASTDTVRITLTNADVARANVALADDGVTIAPFVDGDVLSAIQANTQQTVDAVAVSANPTVDDAAGTCPYTLGLGAVPPP
jgi:serine protease AprX